MNPEVLSFDCRKNSMSCQEKAVVSGDRMLVSVPPHPLIKHWISVLGNEQTPYPVLTCYGRVWEMLLYEASRNWQFMGYRCRHANTMSCQAAKEKAILSGDRSWVFVPPHPFIKRWVSMLRNEQTPCPVFKNAMAELGRLLIYEASRDCKPPMSGEIESPMGVASVEFIDPKEPIVMVPILRSGLALAEHAESVLPATKTYHIGCQRNFPKVLEFVVDPMLATGGTLVAALELIKERGVDNKQIKVVGLRTISTNFMNCLIRISAVAAPRAFRKLIEKFPGLHVYAGILDPNVNEKGFMIPRLGDAGDFSDLIISRI